MSGENKSSSYPGGSRQRVNRAGDRIRNSAADHVDLSVVNEWREAHRHVINSFQAILRNKTKDMDVVIAQRHKRKQTIFDKLTRYPKMKLSRMDDVAGCRLIFRSVDDLNTFRRNFHSKSQFNHKLKNSLDKYDYINSPKDSGYRGIHDVYEYDVRSKAGRDRKGLLIELQYRTGYQHAWATAVELVGHITADQPKFDRGDGRVKQILRLASEVIARAHEDMASSLPDLSNADVVNMFMKLDRQLNFMDMLRGLTAETERISNAKSVILVFHGGSISGDQSNVEVRSYRRMTVAIRDLFRLERDSPELDVVLVGGDEPGDIRQAFKNYFSDAREFIDLVEKGCSELSVADRRS